MIKGSFREADIVARIGGDEFVALAYDTGASLAESLRQRIADKLDQFNNTGSLPVPASLSIGIEIYQAGSGTTIEQLLESADAKMYQQKNAKHDGPAGTAEPAVPERPA